MSTKRINQFGKRRTAKAAVSMAAVVAVLTACAPAKKVPVSQLFAPTQNSPKLSISRDIDMVRLEGVLRSPDQASQVYAQASELFDASMVINNIAIDETVASAKWIAPVLATVEQMMDVEDFSLVAVDGQLLVGGSVDSVERAEALSDLASGLAGVDLAVSSNLLYPPPAYDELNLAELLDNGAVDVNGPDQMVVSVDGEVDVLVGDEVDGISSQLIATDQLFVSLPADEVENILPEQIPEQLAVQQQDQVPDQVPVQIVEQPAVAAPVAAIESAITPITAALQSVPVPIEIAVNEPVYNEPVYTAQPVIADTDADGVLDNIDQCTTRTGYPVDSTGCQVLEGYLNSVKFSADTSHLVEGSEPELDEIATLLQNHPAAKIAVITHALDATDQHSAKARQRAFLVTSYLESRGVERGRVYAFALAPTPGAGDRVLIKEID